MHSKFGLFVQKVNTAVADEIVSMVQFGSCKGISHPQVSDIDVLVLAKDRNKIPQLVKIIREIEKNVLHINHSEFTNVLEEDSFASNDFKGIHLIIIGRDEINHNFKPKSLKLKIITTFMISRSIFLYNLKHHYKLLIGEDIVKDLKIPNPGFSDRFIPFLDSILFLLVVPFFAYKKNSFKIWCFKVIKFFSEYIETYARIQYHNDNIIIRDIVIPYDLVELAHKGRYNPSSYTKSQWELYLRTWLFIFQNSSFLLYGSKQKH